MAKQHHCPNGHTHVCTALSGRIHVCPICYTRWEEDVGAPTEVAEEAV